MSATPAATTCATSIVMAARRDATQDIPGPGTTRRLATLLATCETAQPVSSAGDAA